MSTMMNKILFLALVTFCLLSCGNKQRKVDEVLNQWINKEIMIPNDLVYTMYGTDTVDYTTSFTDYKILMYVDTVGCTSCQLQLERWIDWMDYLKRKSPYTISYLFNFYPKDIDELKDLLSFNRFPVPVCLDQTDRLNCLNQFPSGWPFHTFLLDSENRVVVLGNPVSNGNIADLYRKILVSEVPTSPLSTQFEVVQSEIELPQVKMDSICAEFVLKNVGKNRLVINNLNTSCGCTSAKYSKEPVMPGDSVTIKVTVKKEKKGRFNETITVYCNTPDSLLALKLYGNII